MTQLTKRPFGRLTRSASEARHRRSAAGGPDALGQALDQVTAEIDGQLKSLGESLVQ